MINYINEKMNKCENKEIKEGINVLVKNLEKIKNLIDCTFPSNKKVENGDKCLFIYHRADLDGHGIRILVETLKIFDAEFFSCNLKADEAFDFILENHENYDKIIIGDLSFTEEKAELLDNRYPEIYGKLILLDHHASASYMEQYSWALIIPHNEKELILSSGTLLVYLYLEDYINKKK